MKTSRFISLLLCVVMIMSLFTGLAGSASADDVITHEVKSGEIMLKICEKHGLNYYACKDAIMALNGFTSEAQLGKLTVGQKLRLPASDALAKTTTTSTAVVTSTTVGGTTLTTTTNYVGTTAAGGNVAYYLTPYTVQAGDTLAGICTKLNSNYYYYSPVILGVNALANANFIKPGQVLLIPTNTPAAGAGYSVVAHTVQNGENMTAICNRYGVSYQAMRTLVNGVNRRDNMDKIYVGQTVYVPGTAAGVAAATTTTTTSSGTPGTITTTTTPTGTAATASTAAASTAAAGAAYSISFSNSSAFASSNGKDYVTATTAGSEVSVWSVLKSGYALKGIEVIRLDTGALVPVDYNYFTMPNSNVYVEVEYEKGLTIQKEKSLYGSFDALVYGSSTSAAFQGDEVTVRAYPFNSYTVASVSYQRSDRSSSAVEVKPDAKGNYKFTMPSYPILLKVTFAPTVYHKLSSVNTVGKGTVKFEVNGKAVTKAEMGQTVHMVFTPEKNWQFNNHEFEGNLLTHMPARNSVTNFQKINTNSTYSYSFVMGSSDITIDGAQFLNRITYDLLANVQSAHGTVSFNVISQSSGAITYNAKKAKFGDTVQVLLSPDKNYVADTKYMKDNSFANGNLLPWGVGTTSFTMPDGKAAVNVRFIEDGKEHIYAGVSTEVSPAAGGVVTILQNGSPVNRAESGKIVTISIKPNPNYAVNKAKNLGGVSIWAVTVNGKYTDNAPAEYEFKCLDKNTFTFRKTGGHDKVRVVFASDYQGTPVKFQQVIAGTTTGPSDPPVKNIKNFSVNGGSMNYSSSVRVGDIVSFAVELEKGYEVVQVRKFAQDSSGVEIPGTSYLISGGSLNGYKYSYNVIANDVHRDTATGEVDSTLVFEITAQQKAGYSYTVHYTEPTVDGKRISSFSPGNGIYYIDVVQTTSAATLGSPDPRPNALGNNGDISDISANRVEADDALIIVTIPVAQNNNIQRKDPLAQKKYVYSFEKLLINGSEWPVESDGVNYIAKVPYPKGTPNRIVTTELVYKASGPYDYPLATLSDIMIDNAAVASFNPNVLNYSVDSSNVDGSVTPLADATPASGMERKILINGLVYMDYGVTTPPASGDWVWHYGGNDVQIYVRDADPANAPDAQDNIYKVSVNCGLPAAKLTALSITGGGQPATGMADFNPTIGNYEAFVADKSVVVTPTAEAGCSYTIVITGPDGKELAKTTDTPASATLESGKNLVTVTVEGPDKVKTNYKVTVFCDYDATTTESSALKEITIGSHPAITIESGKYEYDITIDTEKDDVIATLAGSDKGDITIVVNGTKVKESTGKVTSLTASDVTWNTGSNTVLVTVEEEDKSATTYTVHVTCNLEASKLAVLEIDGESCVDTDGQLTKTEVKVNKDISTIKLQSKTNAADSTKTADTTEWTIVGVDNGTWTDDGSGAPYKWKWEDDNATSRQLEIKVKEENKTEATYTLTIVDDRPESLLENYLTIEGTAIPFDSDHQGSASPVTLNSEVLVVLDKTYASTSPQDDLIVEVDGTELTYTSTGSDANGNPRVAYTAVWPSTTSELKITVKYENCKENVYTVSVSCKPADVTLKEMTINGISQALTGASGLTFHDGDVIKATATADDATVQIAVFGEPSSTPYPYSGSAVKTFSATENTDFHWLNNGAEDSNRIEITVTNGMETQTYVYTGKRAADTSLSAFSIAGTPYSVAGATGITMNSGASEALVATATDSNATVEVTISGDGTGPWTFTSVGTVSVTEGTNFNWSTTDSKSNLISVTVTNGGDSQTYTYSGTTA